MILIPMILYLVLMFAIAIYTNKFTSGKGGFMEEYFIGGRSMGGFVLAMTLIATYSSASSFVGGPGVAYSMGYGWILLAMIQVPTAFLTLGVLGKKFAIISRKINAVTVTDYLKARYNNKFIVISTSVAMVIFFAAAMVAQFIGGAKLFEAVTGYSYFIGLVIFGITVIVYTTIGGFRAVAITDAIQGIVMVLATIFLLVAIIHAGGGMAAITAKMIETNPSALTPTAGGKIPIPFILSFWVLVGFAVLGLPQTTVRCMGFKDSKSLHRAMVIGTVVVGFLMLGMHLVGTLGAYVVPGLAGDGAIPGITVKVLPPILAGIFIAGPLAAIMSTVDSMLILASASIIKDLYLNYGKGNIDEKTLNKISFMTTGIIGIGVFIFAIKPPSIIVWINLFAFGGLEAVFLWPTILGLYWKKANADGALISIVTGLISFFIFTIYKVNPFGMHQIVPTLAIALVTFIAGSLWGRKNDAETIKLFFGE
ncbi:sodium/pantothenate symporter [Fusibacter sp. Q10-2]|uniref:Sodium/pantothenate symporter n=2 Tax=Fusibacter ferrireducens TaxID=2785058 RepID=A0ABR9ZWJ8_9FIRM|nr:sodium/pantothenate symporter [Fusibacter ferrireducens]